MGVGGLAGAAMFWGSVWLLILAGSAAYNSLFLQVGQVPVYLGLSVAIGCLSLGVALFWLRDLRSWRSVAVAQIVIAIIAGTTAFFGTDSNLSKSIGLIAAAVTVANGIKRLWELQTTASKASR
jgi:hypothetical protein